MVSRETAWTDTTDIIASATPVRLKAVVVDVPAASSALGFVQLFDSADATPGTTAPFIVLPIPRVATMGSRRRLKYVFAGGVVCGTGLTWLVTTTHDGATVPTGADVPLAIEVHYEKL